jgi:ABC-2 type transport system ATP-binding protein
VSVDAVVEARDVVRRFGDRVALAGVTLEIAPGESVALLGPNGAGKTTLISLALGLRRPDAGRVRLFGRDPRDPEARREVGATPQTTGLPEFLTVRETLALVRSHYARPASMGELLTRFGLAELERRQTGGLSTGEKRRLAVALAFAGNPRALFLDEPTTGLDVESRRVIWDCLRRYASGDGTVLLTTHHLEEAAALATRVIVVHRGLLVADGGVEALMAAVGATTLEEAYLVYTGADA